LLFRHSRNGNSRPPDEVSLGALWLLIEMCARRAREQGADTVEQRRCLPGRWVDRIRRIPDNARRTTSDLNYKVLPPFFHTE